jgi:uncharacterized low-complexity protein
MPTPNPKALCKRDKPKHMQRLASHFTFTVATLLLLTACSDKKDTQSLTEGGMKCGAGKCGASMANGSALLVKKKMNILNQLKKGDSRRDCVLKAPHTKALYNCVRDRQTGRLSIDISSTPNQNETYNSVKNNKEMKCEAGKCSSGKLSKSR